MFRFSLRQIFAAIVALAAGLAIWRLPKGDWIDIPLAVLSVYFVLSLLQHAAATRRLLGQQAELPREQLWGGRILIAELVGTAVTLVVALVFRYLAAAELVLLKPEDRWVDFLNLPTLPRDLAALAMLVATGLASWQTTPRRAIALRQNVYLTVAAAGTVVYWADRMVLWFLVYVALSGVEMARPRAWLTPGIHVIPDVRADRFMVGSFAALPLAIANLLLIGGLVKWWNTPRRRRMFMVALAVGLTTQCCLAGWIMGPGFWQLSPWFFEVLEVPPLAAIVVVAAMILLAVGAFTWRLFAAPAPVDPLQQPPERKLYFHENWFASLLLGAVATTCLVGQLAREILAVWRRSLSVTEHLELIVYDLIYPATQFLWLAAAIGGFALAWVRWRRRKQPIADVLPCVNPALFTVTMVSSMILVVASAPIIAAASFCFWFLIGR